MAMSLTALAVVLGSIAIFGVVHETDEGAAAHIWQLLMAGQLPVLAFFAIKWLPRAPKPTLCVLSLQAAAALASMAPVFFSAVETGRGDSRQPNRRTVRYLGDLSKSCPFVQNPRMGKLLFVNTNRVNGIVGLVASLIFAALGPLPPSREATLA